jgi:fibronectin type 3 domain-containing protein
VTAVTATGLAGGATYFYAVTAYDYNGGERDFYTEISYTAPLPTIMPPAITLSAQGQSSVTLTWDPSAGSAVAGYRLYEGGASQTYTNVIEVGNATAVTATALAGGAVYFYAVTAYDTNGAESAFSGEISYTVPLPANPPPTFTLTALGGSVLLSGAGQAGQTYSVLASQDLNIWTVIGTVTTDASGSFTFTDPVGTSSPIPTYRLQSTAVTPPALQIQAAAGDPGSVTLTWDPTLDIDVAGYRLYEGGASQAYTNALEVGNVTTVSAIGLAGGATYFYAVTAYDYNGVERDFYTEISYTIPLPANPPPTISLTALGGSVLLSGAGQAGQTYNVLASQDLNIWTVIGTVTTDASGSFTFTDPAGTSLPHCMYRLQAQ